MGQPVEPGLPPYGSETSVQGSGLATIGLQICISANTSPAAFYVVLNATDYKSSMKSDIVDTTNYGDLFHRRIITLLDYGPVSFKVMYIPTEPTHHNGVDGTAYGLRYLQINRLLCEIEIIYPDGDGSTDAFSGYVAKFDVTGAIGKTFEADVEIVNSSGSPSLI